MTPLTLLAVDTTTSSCGVALVNEVGPVAEIVRDRQETHSKHLLAMIDEILAQNRMKLSDLSCYAATTGPGSFTGLRIGLSTLKGLSAATGVPVVGVSSLETLAVGAESLKMPVCTAIDARRNEVYAAFYDYRENKIIRISDEMVISPEKLAEQITEKTVFVGSGVEVYGSLLKETAKNIVVLPDKRYHEIRPSVAGIIALSVFKSGVFPDVSVVVPNYIRKSDAESSLEKKLKAGNV